jgi:N-acetylglucosaminyldiphosphoundecaprenol N-acetyl-beta-D-mannosaminyltransferase
MTGLNRSLEAEVPRQNILGVAVSAISIAQALKSINSWVENRNPHYICVTPSNSILDAHDHADLRRIYNQSGLTTPDGMPLVWLLRSYGYPDVERVYGPDLMLAVCGDSQGKHYRHYFYGGGEGVAPRLASNLVDRFPELIIAGFETPPFRELNQAEDRKMIQRIQDAKPDIVWIGLGAPRQDFWMKDHLAELNVPVLIGVGAAFDFHSGTKPQAPRWMRQSGLEWLFRLVSEPRRLWKRYLQLPRFAFLATLQKIGIIKYTVD